MLDIVQKAHQAQIAIITKFYKANPDGQAPVYTGLFVCEAYPPTEEDKDGVIMPFMLMEGIPTPPGPATAAFLVQMGMEIREHEKRTNDKGNKIGRVLGICTSMEAYYLEEPHTRGDVKDDPRQQEGILFTSTDFTTQEVMTTSYAMKRDERGRVTLEHLADRDVPVSKAKGNGHRDNLTKWLYQGFTLRDKQTGSN